MTSIEPTIIPLPALAPAQHKAQLWADDSHQVFAVIMGERVPDLPAKLADADVIDHDCLLPGALEPELQQRAPYLVQLRRESAFTDWLLFEAGVGLGDWGVLVCSPAKRLFLRSHLRGLLQARTPEGQQIAIDWMDPQILQILLPRFDPAGLSAFMGPVQSYVVAGADRWFTASLNLGQLLARSVPLTKAA